MKKTISKRDIIKALQTEPLFPGSWIETGRTTDPNCQVCAVGAVLRSAAKVPGYLISDLGNGILWHSYDVAPDTESYTVARRKAVRYCKQKAYLAGLSLFFESLWESYPRELYYDEKIKSVRKTLIRFVMTHFPNRISMEQQGKKYGWDAE